MVVSDVTNELTLAELRTIYAANAEPFASVNQCDVFLRAATIMRMRLPAESEIEGERISLRDVDLAMVEARKARSVFLLTVTAQTPIVIVPPDQLR